MFNRVLVAGIIRVLKDHDVYVKCTNTALAIALENNEDHHVRQEIGRYPANEICDAIKKLLQMRRGVRLAAFVTFVFRCYVRTPIQLRTK